MKPKQPHYRLTTRDLSWGMSHPIPVQKAGPVVRGVLPDESHTHRLSRAIDEVYLPHIGEHLTQISTYDLTSWQRSCVWARGWRIHDCSIQFPRAIVPFLDNSDYLCADGQELMAAAHSAHLAENELRAINAFEGGNPGDLALTTLLGKIAALSVFEKSPWAKKHRTDIRQEALPSSEMSFYFAASTTPTVSEWEALAESICQSSRFSYAALKLPHLPISAPILPARDLFKRRVRENTLLHWALEFGHSGQDRPDLISKVVNASAPTADGCALAITLDPWHPRVPGWIAGLDKPQLAYETRRLLRLSHQLDAEALLAPKLGPIAQSDPRWAYHWIRDFSEGDYDSVSSLLPHLEWIAELIGCGACSVAHADSIDDQASKTMDIDNWKRSSFLLFAGDQAKQNEKN